MQNDHPAKNVALKTGERIKDFQLVDTYGDLYRITDYVEIQPLILVFYRGDW